MVDERADRTRVGAFIDDMIRRERRLLLARSLVLAAFAMLGIAALMVLAVLLQWDRASATLTVVVVGGVGIWAAALWPVLGHWSDAGDQRRQALRVEEVYPRLRGRLVTVVERRQGVMGQESPMMLEFAAQKAMSVVDTVEPRVIHPVGSLYWSLAAWGALGAVVGMLSGFVPGGPISVVQWWQAGFNRVELDGAIAVAADTDTARVGDLVLRYTYPDYTGLDPKVVPNSTGDAAGPPGTQVEVLARAAEPVEAAALVAYGEPALDASVSPDGRGLTGVFTIQSDPGTYHLVLYQGGQPVPTSEFSIEPEEDLAPEVMLETKEDVIELALDQSFVLKWRARDDFGVDRVELRVDGREIGRVLSRPSERRAELFGEHYARPAELVCDPETASVSRSLHGTMIRTRGKRWVSRGPSSLLSWAHRD